MSSYTLLSLDTHLFFARIMKEHGLFLEAGFPCVENGWIEKADWLRHSLKICFVTQFKLAVEELAEKFYSQRN